ncbi:hypothetical protein ASE66_07300 [Bosea sp. Root483D1]|nr:hypothetical protein ASE66_07300 [Bosea sp. Root483D1]
MTGMTNLSRRLFRARMMITILDGMQMERRAFLTALLGGVLAAVTAEAAPIERLPTPTAGALDTLDAEFTQGPPQPRAPGATSVPAHPRNPRRRRKNWHRYRQRNRRPLPPPPRHRGR